MRATDDTYVPGYLIEKAAQVVGARRAAAFRVREIGDDGTHAIELFRYIPADETDKITDRKLADAMRRYVIPGLIAGRDLVIDVPERDGPIFKCFVLVFLARDAGGVRGVTAMEVGCGSRLEAEQRLMKLTDIMS
jgi:hypothetical protein